MERTQNPRATYIIFAGSVDKGEKKAWGTMVWTPGGGFPEVGL